MIGWAPRTVDYNVQFTVTVNTLSQVAPNEIDRVTLVRTGAVTHGLDQNQRFIELNFTAGSGPADLAIPSPANPNFAPPGYYMLFLISDQEVPSVAHMIQILDVLSEP